MQDGVRRREGFHQIVRQFRDRQVEEVPHGLRHFGSLGGGQRGHVEPGHAPTQHVDALAALLQPRHAVHPLQAEEGAACVHVGAEHEFRDVAGHHTQPLLRGEQGQQAYGQLLQLEGGIGHPNHVRAGDRFGQIAGDAGQFALVAEVFRRIEDLQAVIPAFRVGGADRHRMPFRGEFAGHESPDIAPADDGDVHGCRLSFREYYTPKGIAIMRIDVAYPSAILRLAIQSDSLAFPRLPKHNTSLL